MIVQVNKKGRVQCYFMHNVARKSFLRGYGNDDTAISFD